MKRSLEQAWREISTDLDEVLDLDAGARQVWLETLKTRDPDRAQRVRGYILDLEKLEKDNFLGQALPLVLSEPPSLAGRRLGSYTVDRLIGHGGMGTVWLAHRSDGRFEGDVAIKLLNTSLLGGGGDERFVREGHLLAKLEHPNIARLMDAGVSDTGQPLLVLEYVHGKPITDYCDSACLDIRARVELFLDVLAAVSHAHSRLVIHRDLKPANIFVTTERSVKLLDFGIARLTSADGAAPQDLTRLGHTPLTLAYASPEQIRGVDIGTASDIYSLGVLLYELMTGALPYRPKRDTLGALEEEILCAQPPLPSRAGSSDSRAQERRTTAKKLSKLLRGDLDTIVLTALEKEQSERYATAAAFAEDLKRYLRSEPILARGESSWYRARKFLVRNKLPVLAATATIIALIAALGIALWQAHVARERATQAQEISHFIESVFEDADPGGSGTADVRAADLLLRGRTRVEEELRNRGRLQIELMCTIGSSLYGLGANTEAKNTFERMTTLSGGRTAAALAQVPTGCLNNYADLLTIMGDYTTADSILRAAEQADGSRTPSLMTGKTLATRATLDLNLNRFDVALPEARRADAIIRAFTPRGSRESLESALQLARVEYVIDENTAALATAERAIAEYTANPGEAPKTRGTFLSLRSLRARALSAVGRRDEAANEYASLLPELNVAFGINTHQSAVDLYEYSVIEQHRGELRHAIELGNRAFAATQAGGSSQRGVASACIGLALSYLLARNVPAGLAWALKGREVHDEIFGPADPERPKFEAVAIFAGGLAATPLEAVAQLQPLVDQRRAIHAPYLARLLWFQGELYLRAGQYRQAAGLLQEAEQLAVSHPDLGFQLPVIRADLGRSLLGLGQLDAAAGKLQAALSGAEVPHTATPAQAEAHAGLALVLLKQNDPRAALAQAGAAEDFWRDFDPENPARKEAAELRSRASRALTASTHQH